MTDEEKMQSLIRLKRHEAPPEGFFDDFLRDFQNRQRRENLERSVFQIAVERLQMWWSSLQRPAVIWTAVGCYAFVMLGVHLWPRPTNVPDTTTIVVQNATAPSHQQANPAALPAVGRSGPIPVSHNPEPLREIPTWKERTMEDKKSDPNAQKQDPSKPKLREL